ncbi:MAG: hypothetical protein V3V08_05335 [Nannocystaceae bacterium]
MAAPETTKLPVIAKTASWVETRIHKALAKARDERSAGKSGRLALSQIGKCERGLWGGVNGIPDERPPEGRILVLFDLGEAVETHVVELLRLAGFEVLSHDPDTGEQFRITGFGENASGRLDGLVRFKRSQHATDERALLEVKSANAKKFDELLASGSYAAWNPVYGDQVQVYMGRKGLKQALVVVECKNDSQLYVEVIDFDPGRYRELWAKAERIVNAESAPPRPEEGKSQYCGFCKYCSRGKWCWGPLVDVSFDD